MHIKVCIITIKLADRRHLSPRRIYIWHSISKRFPIEMQPLTLESSHEYANDDYLPAVHPTLLASALPYHFDYSNSQWQNAIRHISFPVAFELLSAFLRPPPIIDCDPSIGIIECLPRWMCGVNEIELSDWNFRILSSYQIFEWMAFKIREWWETVPCYGDDFVNIW